MVLNDSTEELGFMSNDDPDRLLQLPKIINSRVGCQVLVRINDADNSSSFASDLSTYVGSTYSHVVKVCGKLEELGFISEVEEFKSSRKRVYRTTEKGVQASQALRELEKSVD